MGVEPHSLGLLRRGYSTPGVRSRKDIADRLVLLYRETGCEEEAETLAAEAERSSRSSRVPLAGPDPA